MAENGCLKDGRFQNLEVEGRTEFTGTIKNRQLDFLTGNVKNLTVEGVVIPPALIGRPKIDSQIKNDALNSWGGSTSNSEEGHTSIYLPAATANSHLALLIGGSINGSNNRLTIDATSASLSTAGKYAFQQVGPLYGGGGGFATYTATFALSTRLVYIPHAVDGNFLGYGSVIHFYCQTAGEWMVRIFNVPDRPGGLYSPWAVSGELSFP